VDVQNVSASDRDFQKLDGGIAIVDMASLLRYSPGQHIHLGGAVDKNGEGKIDLNLQVHCWGRDPAVVGALSDAINTMRPEESGGADSDDGDDDQELSKYDNDGITFLIGDDDVGEVRPRVNPWEKENNGAAERHCAAWRSMWLRTSTKPQDMVFSTMHLLGANLEVNYKRELEDIVFELIGNIPSSRGWLSMGYDIPVMPSSGLIPMLPKFTAQSEPTYSVDGEVRLASSMVSYDFVCTYFDMEIKSTDKENGHVICARMLDVKHSSVPEKWVQSSEYDYRSYLRLSNPGQDINTGCRFKGRIGNIVVIVGKRQSDNEPFVYLLGKDKRGVYQKTGAGTLEETLFLWPDDLNNMEWRHLRVGGGPGAKLAPCNCGKVNSTNKYNPHFSNQDELDTALLHAWQSESRLRLLLGMGANINAQMEGDTTALQEACLFGGNERVVELMLEGGADICAQGGVFGNALNAASYGGYDQVVRMLIEKGADIDAAHEHYGYPLQIAAKENNDAVVKVLLELRAHVNSRGRPGEDALTAAASRGHQAVVEILLKHGADMNGRGENHSYPLTAAMANGHLGVVQTLLQNGAYVNIWGGKLPTPLMAAALQGSVEGIRLLMSHGANVDAKGFAEVHNEGGPHVVTALQSACYKDNFDAVRLLLGFGADVNTRGGSYGTAVGVAAHFGHTEIVRLLIESGAEIEAIGGDFGSALQAAAPETYGDEMLHYNEDVMLLLLGYGADVNAQGGIYGTALQAAVSDLYQKAKERAVRELIKRGADVNAKGGKFGTALQAAIHSYTGNMIQLLIKNGADATKLDNDHLEKLQRACYTGNHLGKVQQLVREGSAVNAITGRYHGTALQAASCNDFVATVKILGSGCRRILRDVPSADDHLQIVQELVENGAVVNVQAGYYGNALQAASCNGYAKVVRYLLRKGANVNARGGRYGNALQAAARHGHKSIVEQLIRAGANVNAGVDRRGYSTIGLHGNALLAGVLNGSEMVELLLSKGARIDGVDDQRRNALHIAAAQGNCDLIDFLLSHGVDVSHCDLQGRSILHHAASSGSVKVVQHLLALRVRTNISDDDGWNALHWAARKGTMAVVRQLIEAGVDRTAKSLEGWTPLRVAIYHKNLSLAALLAVPPRLSHSTPHKSKIRQLDLGTPIK
jgi:ankyrin repeat protein